ncbi:MAG TPA: glycosyltransferase family 87 protein [Thermoanaerobaculia bacterium]|nr:glycosyltransferase family 87 protein [Thermoanaerobaculia bacterium]
MPSRRGAWLLLAVFLGIYGWRNGLVVWPWLFQTEGDFGNYWRAAGEILDGRSPFTPTLNYPPLIAFLLLPLGALPLDAARVSWFLISHACVLGAAVALWRPLGRDLRALAVLGALWACGGTLQENLALGQVNSLLLLVLALAIRWELERPGRAAAMIGLGAGLKLWPGLLLLQYLARGRFRALAVGVVALALCVTVPLLLVATFLPPPHLPQGTGYWMGTPAPLNVSLPALALRLTYPIGDDGDLPQDWKTGTSVGLHLDSRRRQISVVVSLTALALGLGALALARWGKRRPDGGRWALVALTALAGLAAPLSWYHYQLLQFPGLALLGTAYLHRRAWLPLAGLVALTAGLTRNEIRDLLVGDGGAERSLVMGAVIVLLNTILFVLLLREMRRDRSEPTPRNLRLPSRDELGDPACSFRGCPHRDVVG